MTTLASTLTTQRLCLVFSLAAAIFSTTQGSARAEVSQASSAYDAAAEAVRNSDLPRAKRAFLLAYIEAPRPIILYNLGLVCRDLGQPDEAAAYFQRYLDEASVAPDDPIRKDATNELSKLSPDVPSGEQGPAIVQPTAAAPPARATTSAAPSVTTTPARPNSGTESSTDSSQLWSGVSIGIGSVGLATALASGALLFLTPPPSTSEISASSNSGDKTAVDQALSDGFSVGAARQNRSDTRSAGFVGLIAGTTLLVGATVLWFTLGSEERVEVGLNHVRLTITY